MNYDARKVTYQEVTIFDRPALFTECRIDRAPYQKAYIATSCAMAMQIGVSR